MKFKIFGIVGMMVCAIAVIAFGMKVYAQNSTPDYFTGTATAGEYKMESVYSLSSSTLGTLYGGDVGIWFFDGNSGLQQSFKYIDGRVVYIQCWELDTTTINELARKYEGYFKLVDGVYRVCTYSNTYTSKDKIEDDNTAELYMRFMVQTKSDDTTKAVPKNILHYCFWVY